MYRAYVNSSGTITVEPLQANHEPIEGAVGFVDAPNDAELAAAFPDAVLKDAKNNARAKVSTAAEEARLQFVTAGSAKAMAYQEKAKEAVELLTDPEPSALKYPIIYAEVGVTADTALGVAQIVNARYQGFKQIEAVIGGREAAAQKAIAAAKDVAAIDAVIAGLAWPAPAES